MPRFHLNGQDCTVDADPAVPLLSVLRDEQGLSGPKFGCGQGECGACMVLVDGQPQTACNLPLWAVEGRRVVTVEGLGTADQPHPVQTAFCEERAAQCGYCANGWIMHSVALLEKNGEVVALGAGAAVLGHPAAAIAMLVNKLAESGETLPAGTLVLSGGITEAVAVGAGDHIALRVQGMGSVSVRFA